MVVVREPVLKPVSIKSLRPTQITVGMREVKEKRKQWRKHDPDKKAEFLGKHMIPVILGPKKRHYVIDHHHLSLALHDEGVEDVLVEVVADLQELDRDAFWTVLDFTMPGCTLRHRRRPPPLQRHSENRRRAEGRSVSQPRRRVAPRRRLRQGHGPPVLSVALLWADFLRRWDSRKVGNVYGISTAR